MEPLTSHVRIQRAVDKDCGSSIALEGTLITSGVPPQSIQLALPHQSAHPCVVQSIEQQGEQHLTQFSTSLIEEVECNERLLLTVLATFTDGTQRAYLSELPTSPAEPVQAAQIPLALSHCPSSFAEQLGLTEEGEGEQVRKQLSLRREAQIRTKTLPTPKAKPAIRQFEHRTPPSLGWIPTKGHSLRICIATNDFSGPIRNGGIGTACRTLAEALVNAGHRVSVAYTSGDYAEEGTIEEWVDRFRRERIEFVPLNTLVHIRRDNGVRGQSYELYQWLKTRQFDWIHFTDWRGIGFHSMQAKALGAAFSSTRMTVTLHSPNRWHTENNSQFISDFEGEEVEMMERETLRLADLALSPSAYMFEWAQKEGWELPQSCEVLQNIPALPPGIEPAPRRDPVAPRELVFFGRLETRKGLKLFCDTIDLLQDRLPANVAITFLGKEGTISLLSGAEYARLRSRRWRQRVEVKTDLNQQDAIAYLVKEDRLAVIASLVDNSPCTVAECLHLRIPFIAAAVGGVAELVHPEDRESNLFAPDKRSLAETVMNAVTLGCPIARPRYRPEELTSSWLQLHETELTERPVTEVIKAYPLVSICIPHYNRPLFLAQALASVEQQGYTNLEVLVVDDGSTNPDALAFLSELERRPFRFPLRVLRQQNAYVGAARNLAGAFARGDYLAFLDDDNVMKPDAIESMVAAIALYPETILTCVVDKFIGNDAPTSATIPLSSFVPLGSSIAVAPFLNAYGDIFALIPRQTFLDLGGFTEDPGITHEDWEFFTRAALAGHPVQPLPKALLWYRYSDESMSSATKRFKNFERSARPFKQLLPPFARTLVDYGLRVRMNQLAPRPTGPRTNDLLRATELFHRAQTTLLKLSSASDLKRLTVLPPTESALRWEGLHILAPTEDPIILLPYLETSPHRMVVMKISITVPALTSVQLFYSRHGDPLFYEECSVNNPAHRGVNTLHLALPEDRFSGFFRLDPGNRPGHYIVHSIELREVDRIVR